MEEEIIDTDSPNGASTCCVYVGSDDSMVSTVSLLQKKKENKTTAGYMIYRASRLRTRFNEYSGRLRERQR